ncbi:MAG TPA: hypothetical protein H9697_10140 [Candidatus Mediterraneibacter faecavium]|uniref:ABC transporter permease n=1 Tax=Candidatus Mediterraneibacter faecavium TaxID=2838668 RepID=A0A9D2Q9A5_9FIRM|nr:hypothetical protein [Candidatus Mediterraneibacter faecavium]
MHTYHLTQWLLFFFIYSFIGWIWESCYVSARKRQWVNRGFLHGPMLPIYGSGALVILISTIGVRENPWLIFLFGMLAATVLEYITGAAMEKLFHVRYWDYSRQKLNLNGYICASSSLCWGAFSVLLVRVIHVPVERAVLDIPLVITDGAALVLTVIMSVDLTQSFNEAMDLKRVLIQLEESKEQIKKMQEKLKTASDGLIADYKIRSEKLVEDYRARVEEAAEKSRSRKAAYLERIGMKRAQRQLQLEELTERVEYLMKMEIPAKADSLIGEKRREELSELKKVIVAELHRMSSRTDRIYLHIASQLKRNPTAASEKFADVLEELKRTLDNLK